MKKAKRITILCIILLCLVPVLAFAVYGGNRGIVQGRNNPDGGIFYVEEIGHSPADYVGVITLIGIVGDSVTQDFSLQNEDGTFQVLVDYRGSQALPQLGSEVIVHGQLRVNRPCCGPGYTLTSTRFEWVE